MPWRAPMARRRGTHGILEELGANLLRVALGSSSTSAIRTSTSGAIPYSSSHKWRASSAACRTTSAGLKLAWMMPDQFSSWTRLILTWCSIRNRRPIRAVKKRSSAFCMKSTRCVRVAGCRRLSVDGSLIDAADWLTAADSIAVTRLGVCNCASIVQVKRSSSSTEDTRGIEVIVSTKDEYQPMTFRMWGEWFRPNGSVWSSTMR